MPSSALTATSIGILRDMDPARRKRELRALRDHAPLDTLDAIISILENPEQELRLKAVQSLSLFRGHLESRAEAVAKHLLQNADPHVRLGCAMGQDSIVQKQNCNAGKYHPVNFLPLKLAGAVQLDLDVLATDTLGIVEGCARSGLLTAMSAFWF